MSKSLNQEYPTGGPLKVLVRPGDNFQFSGYTESNEKGFWEIAERHLGRKSINKRRLGKDFFLENNLVLGRNLRNRRKKIDEDLFFLENSWIWGWNLRNQSKILRSFLPYFYAISFHCTMFSALSKTAKWILALWHILVEHGWVKPFEQGLWWGLILVV